MPIRSLHLQLLLKSLDPTLSCRLTLSSFFSLRPLHLFTLLGFRPSLSPSAVHGFLLTEMGKCCLEAVAAPVTPPVDPSSLGSTRPLITATGKAVD